MDGDSGSTRKTFRPSIAPEPPEHFPIGFDLVITLGSLQNHDHVGQSSIRHDTPERCRAQRSLADELVPVAAGCKWRLGVVEMKAAELFQAVDVVPATPDAIIIAHQIVP